MKVVIDTNIWISDLALQSAIGSAVRFYLQNTGAEICVPEVIRLETEEHLREILNANVRNARKNFGQLLAIFGELKELVLPSSDEIEKIVRNVFTGIDVRVRDIPFTKKSARDSFLRTIKKISPSDRSQQFKDGVIWADCMKLLKEDVVCLVTEDKVFYEGRIYENGLVSDLKKEVTNQPNELRLFSSLAGLLEDVKSDYQIDQRNLVSSYMEENSEIILQMVSRSGLSLTDKWKCDPSVFATEDSRTLFIEFEIWFDCQEEDEQVGSKSFVLAKGTATLNTADDIFENIARRGEQLLLYDDDGLESIVENTVVAVGSAVLGHRTVHYSTRHQL